MWNEYYVELEKIVQMMHKYINDIRMKSIARTTNFDIFFRCGVG